MEKSTVVDFLWERRVPSIFSVDHFMFLLLKYVWSNWLWLNQDRIFNPERSLVKDFISL